MSLDTARHEFLHAVAAAAYLFDQHERLYHQCSVTHLSDRDGGAIVVNFPSHASKDVRDNTYGAASVGPLAPLSNGLKLFTASEQVLREISPLSEEDIAARWKFHGSQAQFERNFRITRSIVRRMDLDRIAGIFLSAHLQTPAEIPLCAISSPTVIRRAIDHVDQRARINNILETAHAR
ncbi:hypothetical protein LCM28_09900 [Salipiger pacificus]|nr:hypothetical protein [Alloyangia pacifica]